MCENKDRNKAHRPDLELELLVMGDDADGRPSSGWLVREDVVRGAVELIKGLRDRVNETERVAEAVTEVYLKKFDADTATMELKSEAFKNLAEMAYSYAEACGMKNYVEATVKVGPLQAHDGEERFFVTLQRCQGKTPNDLKVEAERERDELREQVDALTAQLEEEEAQVKRLREVVLGAVEGEDGERTTEHTEHAYLESLRQGYEARVKDWEAAQVAAGAPMAHVQLAVDPIEEPGKLAGYVVFGRLLDWFPARVVVAPLPWPRRVGHRRQMPDTPLAELGFAVWEAESGFMIGEPFADEVVVVTLAKSATLKRARAGKQSTVELFTSKHCRLRGEQFRASALELARRYVAEMEGVDA